MIIVVTGGIASGKTEWIRQEMAKNSLNIGYFSPKTESFPMDFVYLQSEFSDLSLISVGQEDELESLSAENRIYIEIPWYLEDKPLAMLLNSFQNHPVTHISMETEKLFSQTIDRDKTIEWLRNKELQIHRATLRGEVLDFASLETFWAELTQGAYGEVIRIKGIFDIMDGRTIYGEFLQEFPQKDFQPLNLPLCLNGRPNRFSGTEIVGRNLNQAAIVDTLSDCCLSDEIIAYYQRQVKESLNLEMETVR